MLPPRSIFTSIIRHSLLAHASIHLSQPVHSYHGAAVEAAVPSQTGARASM